MKLKIAGHIKLSELPSLFKNFKYLKFIDNQLSIITKNSNIIKLDII